VIQVLVTSGIGLHDVIASEVSPAWIEDKGAVAVRRNPTEMLPAEDVEPEGRHGSLVVDSE